MKFLRVSVAALSAWGGYGTLAEVVKEGSTCTVTPLGSGDDTPQIKKAFQQCATDSRIVFQEGTYNIRQVMEFLNLRNVSIDIYGKFLWSADNLQYWIANTLPVTYAGLYTAWKLGGTDIALRGHGKALFDGNGQVWIDENRNGNNRRGRPINLTLWRATNVLVDGITWRQSQFWHTFVAHSKNVTMTNLDMKTVSNSQWNTVNTDGVDTWNSQDVFIRNWTVTCGDASLPCCLIFLSCRLTGCAGLHLGQGQQQEHRRPQRDVLRVRLRRHRVDGQRRQRPGDGRQRAV